MRLGSRAISRYRPRLLTLMLLFAIAALLVLANLSFDPAWPTVRRLESLELSDCDVGDSDLRRLTLLPRLKALDLGETSVTAAGIAELTSLKTLEELALAGHMVSSKGLRSLSALPHLKTLHLGRSTTFARTRYAQLTLDDGEELPVLESDAEALRQAICTLRKAQPGIVINGGYWKTGPKEDTHLFDDLEDAERDPQWFPAPTWLPASDWPWVDAADRSAFESEGGWARFDAARWGNETIAF